MIVVVVRLSRLAEHDVASHIRLVAGLVRAIDHQVILARRSRSRDLDVVMMDVRLTLTREIVLLLEAEGRRTISCTRVAMAIEVVVHIDLVRLKHHVVREIHLQMDAVCVTDQEGVAILRLFELDDRLRYVRVLLLTSGEKDGAHGQEAERSCGKNLRFHFEC